jgi:hypothetical protein
MKRGGRGTATNDSTGPVGNGISETAVRKATGKGWGDWYSLLDAAGAREMTHQQIIGVVAGQESGGWWQQAITVAYEQARSIRTKHPKDDGFSANASKTIRAGVTRVFAAWVEDPVRAGWLDTTGWHIRKSIPYRTLRVTWTDGRTHLDIHFWPRGEGRTLIQIDHSRLGTVEDVQRFRGFWASALERLRELLETVNQPESLAA